MPAPGDIADGVPFGFEHWLRDPTNGDPQPGDRITVLTHSSRGTTIPRTGVLVGYELDRRGRECFILADDEYDGGHRRLLVATHHSTTNETAYERRMAQIREAAKREQAAQAETARRREQAERRRRLNAHAARFVARRERLYRRDAHETGVT